MNAFSSLTPRHGTIQEERESFSGVPCMTAFPPTPHTAFEPGAAVRSRIGALWWLLWLGVLLVLSGAISVSHGADAMWDLKNYHLYNPFEAYHRRYATDVAPVQVQSYLNPLLTIRSTSPSAPSTITPGRSRSAWACRTA